MFNHRLSLFDVRPKINLRALKVSPKIAQSTGLFKHGEPVGAMDLTVYHFWGHDSLSLAVFNGIVLWGAPDQIGIGYRVPLVFESDIRSGHPKLLIEIKTEFRDMNQIPGFSIVSLEFGTSPLFLI
jgi:hypothetical protein